MVYKIGLLGLGTVGTGVVQILQTAHQRHPLLQSIELYKVGVRSLDKPREVQLDPQLFTPDLQSIVTADPVDIVVELLGGIEPARSLILTAIEHGKHVVTANKAVIARHGEEIFAAAAKAGVYVMLEAAVAGGIPIIEPLKQSLAANRLQAVMGIVNGTTNYILTQMSQKQASFDETLAIAQQKGYAEADPSADIDGWDAADKIAILASLAFGYRVNRKSVYCEGIRSVSATDIRYAQEWGFVIKLLATAQRVGQPSGQDLLDIRVHPTLLPISHPLAAVNQVDNGVLLIGDPIGQLMLSGPGAGRGPTASSVMADVLTIAAQLQTGSPIRNQLMSYQPTQTAELMDIRQLKSRFYARVLVVDKPGVIGAIGTCFGDCNVSLEFVLQKNVHWDQGGNPEQAEIVILTHNVIEDDFQNAVQRLRHLPMVSSIPSVFRVLPE